ncbi:MAG TPA: YidB family protein [Kofleriaceae bacterium]|jgi:uncharacterized protein YidB (DUF937 family)|nr:YidB family protein [Kofleriaceae bacterium]
MDLDLDHLTKVAGPLKDMLGGGGATELLGKLSAGGLGDQVKSWIGKGGNLPVSADQIKSALGSGPIKSIMEKVGLSEDQVSGALAKLLPQAVDHMTPDGKPPAADAPPPDVHSFLKTMTGK